jgi:anti-sigma factor RsiW
MSDQWTDRLSEYLDGDMKGSERAFLEAHLERCEDCQETLAGLRRVVMRARSLEDRPPATDLWAGVAQRIGAPTRTVVLPSRRRFTFSLPQLLAAGIALAVLSASGAWLLHPGAPTVALIQPAPGVPGDLTVTPVGAPSAVQSYDAAVHDLEQVLAQGRGRLDTATVRVLEQNLALIDRAIADARRAVTADSANVYLNTHLAETMRRKVDLLRQAAALVAATS